MYINKFIKEKNALSNFSVILIQENHCIFEVAHKVVSFSFFLFLVFICQMSFIENKINKIGNMLKTRTKHCRTD